MTRALLCVGRSPAGGLQLHEYAVIALHRLPRSFSAWQRLAAELEVELSASWLVLGEGAGRVPDEVKAGFRGCVSASSAAEVSRAARRLDSAASRSRVLTDFETVEKRCARLRLAGKRLVFTNGVFDLFHLGHARLLQAARALGGALVVGINGDDSARRVKGRLRPVVPQFARAEIVAGIRGVDFCVIFGQSDPRELLRAVQPDILVKGTEYTLSRVVGRRMVEGWGGTVRRIAHVTGWSSTELMQAVRRRV
jgi:D-beta-D-heptose 7-phosphate kinase/D-beta-D-heptose 1-phosphate adenosyltransferase